MSKAKVPVLIELFYDVISPYSFLAFEVLHRYKPKWNIDLKLVPVLLGGLMKNSGNSPPAMVPNKGVYMSNDLKRLQKYFNVPLFLPENLMEIIIKKGSLNAQRFITAIDIHQPEYLEGISRALWLRLYNTHSDIAEENSLREAALSIGMNKQVIDDAIKQMSNQQTKDRLKKNTDVALDYGGFGLPLIVAHVEGNPEVFFGSDRFELIAHILGEKWEGPTPGEAIKSKL